MEKQLLFFLIVSAVACTSRPSERQPVVVNDTAVLTKEEAAVQEPGASAKTDLLRKYPLATWLRESPEAIGCIFERAFKVRDSLYNCDTKNLPIAPKDTKDYTELYYKGIEFPHAQVKLVHPLIKSIRLSFEHDDLQGIHIEFEEDLTISRINELFDLPTDKSTYPDNLMEINYGENVFGNGKNPDPNYSRSLTLTGFEHMGPND